MQQLDARRLDQIYKIDLNFFNRDKNINEKENKDILKEIIQKNLDLEIEGCRLRFEGMKPGWNPKKKSSKSEHHGQKISKKSYFRK